MSPDWTSVVSAIAAGASAVVFIVAALFARQQVKEAKELREAQVRPFVVLDFDVQSQAPLIYVTISNAGETIARDVTFTFTPRLESSFDGQPDAPDFADLNIWKNGIRSLVPGKSIAILFDSAIARSELPKTYEVAISYQGEGRRRYRDEMVLDLEMYWNTASVSRRTIHDVHERLKEIRDVLKKWGASGGGLLRLSPKEDQERYERVIELLGEKQPESEQDEKPADG